MSTLIHWYPGHIAKARRELSEKLKLVDVVLELVDARLPQTSRVSGSILGNKPRVVVFTKGDLAVPERTKAWIDHLRQSGERVVTLNAQTGQGLSQLKSELEAVADRVSEKMASRGRLPRASRVMVAGLPNVGKSSLINKLTKRRAAPVGDKPGITRAPSWIRLGKSLELLDTPGIIPPKLEDQAIALKLAMTGGVGELAYDPTLVVPEALQVLLAMAPRTLSGFEEPSLEAIAKARGCFKAGGQLDLERAARTFMHDLRSGALGPLTLDPMP